MQINPENQSNAAFRGALEAYKQADPRVKALS